MLFLSFLFTIISALLPYNSQAGLPGYTKVLTENGLIPIEDLTIGASAVGYSLENGNELSSSHVEKKRYVTNSFLMKISTAQGIFYSSTSQQFYDQSKKRFVAAEELSSNSLLVNKNREIIPCLKVEKFQETCLCYELSLPYPHIFFSTDFNILTHNYAPAFPAIVTSVVELAKIGTAIACFYLTKSEKTEPIKNGHIQKEINIFTRSANSQGAASSWETVQKAADNFKANKPALAPHQKDTQLNAHILELTLNVPAEIGGVAPYKAFFNDVLSNFHQFGPICLVGNIISTGDVECALYILNFDGKEPNGSPRYVWKLAGNNTLRRHDPFVKKFIATEDEKQLSQITAFVKERWDKITLSTNYYGFEATTVALQRTAENFTRLIYGSRFLFSALNSMVTKHLSPSLVLQAVNYGPCKPAKNSTQLIYHSQPLNVVVAINKNTKDIVDVGFFNDIEEVDIPKQEEATTEKEAPKTIEEILKGANPGEETNGPATLYNKPGDRTTAEKDFNDIKPRAVKEVSTNYGPAKIGTLPDGRKIIYRAGSSDGRPTLEIQRTTPSGKTRSIKIRYGTR